MRALAVIHDPLELPAMVGEILISRGFDLEWLTIAESLDNPGVVVEFPDPRGFDLIVPMGSVWSVYDRERIGGWVEPELEFLSEADRAGVPILGICFGGQILATALGGASVPAEEPQIGWYEVRSSEEAVGSGPWFEWHGDRIEPPSGAEIVAWDDSCVQAFRIGRHLGTQFHPEVDAALLGRWLTEEMGQREARAFGVEPRLLLDRATALESDARRRAHRLVDWFLTDVATLVSPAVPSDS